MDKIKSLFTRNVAKAVVGGSALALAGTSFADGIKIDMADVLSTLGLAIVTVTSVCTAAISIVVVIRVFKYVRAAF
ncbi:major capsid protein [Pseudomonas sp.]|jgi:hypothetical protein|uniref:major capsid protein n=1 Tax=Pseudomonas sp. TaxID=306 RepID=UPI0037C6C620